MHAAYGAGEPDRAGYLACIDGRAGLSSLSAERVRMEMLKLLVAEGAAVAVQAMADAGLLLPIFGGVAYTGPFAAMIAVERELGLAPNAVRRLAALTVAVTEDARRVAARLRLSNAETKALELDGPSLVAARRQGRGAGAAAALSARRGSLSRPADAGLGAGGRRGNGAARWRELATLPQRWSAPKFPLKAADFIARGIAEGPALGHVLTLAEDAWLAADFPLDAVRAVGYRRPDRRPFHPRSPAVNILSGFADISLGSAPAGRPAWRCLPPSSAVSPAMAPAR